jgi:SAM-dependent methyltransferase
MRESGLRLLACPTCHAKLALATATERADDGHVMTGSLRCTGCDAAFAIRTGVPRLITTEVTAASTETAHRFGAEWQIFDHMSTYQEEWLARWLDPVGPNDIRGKTVFEAGCGKGRHTLVIAGWGAKEIVALDLGDAVDVAFAHTRHLDNVHVVQGDLLAPPVEHVFDVAFSVGVLHHLPDPRAGFESVRSVVRVGGKVAIWVYGLESNEWIVRWVTPVREHVTARLPINALYWLSLAPSAVIAPLSKVYATRLGERLPYRDYMRRLAEVPLREIHHIVFDQLVTPLAHYLPREEVSRWFDAPGLSDVTIGWHNQNSWRACATVTASK